MSSESFAVRISNLGKAYQIYNSPEDRLKQFFIPKIDHFFKKPPRNFFREFWALSDVSLEIPKGQTVGIIGRNGSGKSTLLQLICGTLAPTTGKIEAIGRIAALLELGSGFNPEFTGRENIYLNASILGLSNPEIDSCYQDIVKFADIGDFIEQPVKTYSSGMVVRLAFAVIAHVKADILVIDEALSVGDAFFTQKCMLFLRTFMQKGTVIFVSHDISSILSLCSRAILLNKGLIVSDGNPKEVSERYLEALYSENQKIDSLKDARQLDSENDSAQILYRDARESLINNSNLRNDVEVFQFDMGSSNFGLGGAYIDSVEILDVNDSPCSWVVGGQDVCIQISCVTRSEIHMPIIGFQFKDKLGQVIFCDNTYISYVDKPILVEANRKLLARFKFCLPILPEGDYSISPAIAAGTQEDHVQHHWIHDSMTLRVHASSICLGLVGLAMKEISLKVDGNPVKTFKDLS